MPQTCTVPLGRERPRLASTVTGPGCAKAEVPEPVLDAVYSLEAPLTMAEGAAAALSIMADSIGSAEGTSALNFLAHHLQQYLVEVREHWTCIHDGVRGGGNG